MIKLSEIDSFHRLAIGTNNGLTLWTNDYSYFYSAANLVK